MAEQRQPIHGGITGTQQPQVRAAWSQTANGIMRQLEIQILLKGIQYFKSPMHKKRKRTMCLPTFVPQFPQAAVQSGWEIPVSQRHRAPFHASQAAWAPCEAVHTTCTRNQSKHQEHCYCWYWVAKLHVGLLKVPSDHRTSPAAFGWVQAEPKQPLRSRKWALERMSSVLYKTSIACLPQHCSVISDSPTAAHTVLSREKAGSQDSPKAPRDVHVQVTTVIHCPNQLQPAPVLPSLHASSPSLLLRVLLNIELRVISFMASQRYLLVLPDGSHKAQRVENASQLQIWI